LKKLPRRLKGSSKPEPFKTSLRLAVVLISLRRRPLIDDLKPRGELEELHVGIGKVDIAKSEDLLAGAGTIDGRD
jgi:hypothetical protein